MDFPTVHDLDGFAGFASLINGLILWPLVKSLKKDHGTRITALEAQTRSRRNKKGPRARNRSRLSR